MAYGSSPGSGLSITAFGCAAAAVLGFGGPLLAGAAVLVALVVLVLSFVLPPAVVLGRL